MKNKFTFLLIFMIIKVNSQIIFNENFDNFGALGGNGWMIQNSSEPVGTSTWGTTTHFPPYNGATRSFTVVNYQSTGSIGTISNWLITPTINLKNGDIISFYSRSDHGTYADRLELRISNNGDLSVLPNASSSSIGDFTTLALTINPDLISNGYPNVWTNYNYTVSGLTGPTNCKIAFRYYVTNAGANAPNGDMIGVDALTITTTTLGNDQFGNNQSVNLIPNPATDFIIIENLEINSHLEFYDLTGKKLNSIQISDKKIDISNLSNGTYILKIISDKKIEIKKFIKT